MTQINAYLNFDGNCRDAMTFYKECLGGELTMQTIADSPMASQLPTELRQNILHACLTRGSLALLGSDMIGPELVKGNTVSLTLHCSSDEEIKTFFSNLASGGEVRDPLADMFWGATFGAVTDKFGINWILNYDKTQN